ncbi:Uncharacterised protein [Collinsella intestinalis]|nr:Uncharacterised protein [Collinsella intestinalis]
MDQAVGVDGGQGIGSFVCRLDDSRSAERRITTHRRGVGNICADFAARLTGRLGRSKRFVHMLDADHEENSA